MEATIQKAGGGVVLRNSLGAELRGNLVHLTREAIVFEVYSPRCDVNFGESLPNLRVVQSGRALYSGEAVVSSVLSTGVMSTVSVTPTGHWGMADPLETEDRLYKEVNELLRDWDITNRLATPYQLAVTNLRAFLSELSRWAAPIDLAVGVAGKSDSSEILQNMAEGLYKAIEPRLKELFEKWEEARAMVKPEELPVHQVFAQRELHPLCLCVPILHRAYAKPLGYAGDYEMVNIILRNEMEGPSIYARLMNAFIVRRDLGAAHRNRITKLTDHLKEEARRVKAEGRSLRVLNIGCGPAIEVERFLKSDMAADGCEIRLVDFNKDTIDYAQARISEAAAAAGQNVKIEFVQKSINDLLKEAIQCRGVAPEAEYDFVYCAGLFDYLSDKVCARVVQLLHTWTRPGGLVMATNVHPNHGLHAVMEDLLEWHLITRTEAEMRALAPASMPEARVTSDATGANVFLEIRKTD